MSEITIPPEAVEAAARAICRERCAFMGEPPCFEVGEGLSPQCDEPGCDVEALAAIRAALAAWPGMHIHEWQRPWLGGMSGTDIILPLPQEKTDE